MPVDPEIVVDGAKAVKEALPETVRQVDKFGSDLLKAVRLILAPLQLAAAWQDRLEGYINRAIRQVPEERRIPPMESVAMPIAERLRFQEETNPITDLYINLLSRAMDGERVSEAHPAFVSIIEQLAPDELLFMRDVAKRDQSIIMSPSGVRMYPSPSERARRLLEVRLPAELIAKANSMMFGYETLNQPEMFPVFFEHLQHLGLVEYHNQIRELQSFFSYIGSDGLNLFSIRLTHFGRLFLRACADELSENAAGHEEQAAVAEM